MNFMSSTSGRSTVNVCCETRENVTCEGVLFTEDEVCGRGVRAPGAPSCNDQKHSFNCQIAIGEDVRS